MNFEQGELQGVDKSNPMYIINEECRKRGYLLAAVLPDDPEFCSILIIKDPEVTAVSEVIKFYKSGDIEFKRDHPGEITYHEDFIRNLTDLCRLHDYKFISS